MAKKKKVIKKKAAKKPVARKKSAKSTKARSKRRAVSAKTTTPRKATKAAKAGSRRTAKQSTRRPTVPTSEMGTLGIHRAKSRRGQSGDLEGLSTVQGADSESVEELMDEGNAFEAGVIGGVERAGDSQREVYTREVPEDDVPGEYLDED